MLSEEQRRFLEGRAVAHLATADAEGVPQVVPVCFAIADGNVYIAIDGKPKRGPARSLKRLRNIAANPAVSLIADRYDDDWSKLGWVMIQGRAEILEGGTEHAEAQALVQSRYPQMVGMDIAGLPVIAVRIEAVTSWGNLGLDDDYKE